jgi:hypothetical protein
MPTSWRAEGAPTGASLGLPTVRGAVVALAGLCAVYVVWRMFGDGASALVALVPARLPFYLGAALVVVFLRALRWRIVLLRLGVRLPLAPLARLWLAGRAVGSLVPSGTLAGEPVRAALLVGLGVSRPTAAGAVALDRSLELAGNMIAGPASVGVALVLGAGSLAGTLVATATALAGLALFVFVYLRARQRRPALAVLFAASLFGRLRWLRPLGEHAARADAALHDLLASHPGLVPAGLALSLAIECILLVELAALFALFALAVPLPFLLLSSIGIGIARVVPVSAALGSLEATQVGIFALGGRTAALGLTVGLVLRVAETLWILVGLACLAASMRTDKP